MTAPRPNVYRLELWGSPEPHGVSDTRHVEMRGYAKLNSAGVPNCVANEYLSYRLATLFGLPVPPGALVEGPVGPGQLAWVALAFTPKGVRPPPADPAEVVRELPERAAEVLVFDILIANTDRHAGNLYYRSVERRLDVFDHSHAPLGAGPAGSIDFYRSARPHLAIDGRLGGNRHCLIDHLSRPADVLNAVDRVLLSVRDGAVEHICEDAAALGLVAEADAGLLTGEIIARRNGLKALIQGNLDQFTAIDPAGWGLI